MSAPRTFSICRGGGSDQKWFNWFKRWFAVDGLPLHFFPPWTIETSSSTSTLCNGVLRHDRRKTGDDRAGRGRGLQAEQSPAVEEGVAGKAVDIDTQGHCLGKSRGRRQYPLELVVGKIEHCVTDVPIQDGVLAVLIQHSLT